MKNRYYLPYPLIFPQIPYIMLPVSHAQVAELVDALVSGTSSDEE